MQIYNASAKIKTFLYYFCIIIYTNSNLGDCYYEKNNNIFITKEVKSLWGVDDSIANLEKDVTAFVAKNVSLLQSQIDILNKMKHDSLAD